MGRVEVQGVSVRALGCGKGRVSAWEIDFERMSQSLGLEFAVRVSLRFGF